MTTIKLTIDGRAMEIEKGKTVLEASLDSGIYIPHLCHYEELSPIGGCRLCVVEIEGREGIQTSCTTLAEDGMAVRTKSDAIDRIRRMTIELIISGHPADCGDCNKYLNCELQALQQYLIEDEIRVKRRTRVFSVTNDNPLFMHTPTKCIVCGRCVRACHELRGVGVLYYKKKNEETYIGVGPDPNQDMPLAEAGCRFCGGCAGVCPTGAILDKQEFGQGKSKKEALLPCSTTCPAEIDVPRYIRYIREGNYTAATAVIREKVPFPAVLGYICNHACETACRRGEVSEAISIRDLKRFAVEHDSEQLWKQNVVKKAQTAKKVAVIGSGPAGLTTAYYLVLQGHAVTVFEANQKPGGMLRYGIPEYRLPKTVIDSEIKDIVEMGVEIRTNCRIESINSLLDRGYNAIVIAVGTHKGIRMNIPGAAGEGVLVNTEFLKVVNEGEPVPLGKSVMVLGGGNVAFDCARSAVRLGAEKVMMACLEAKDVMPAGTKEVREGEEEGITIYPSRNFAGILRDGENITGVEFDEVAAFSFDDNKRLKLELTPDSRHIIACDTVIFAVGQRPEIPEGFEIEQKPNGLVEIDPYSLKTSRDNVFAAGDAVTGTLHVIKAIAAGRKTAGAVDKFLGGRGRIDAKLAPEILPETYLGRVEGFADLTRVKEKLVLPDERIKSSCVVDKGMDDLAAGCEAERCLQCDLRLKMKPVKFWADY